MTEDMRDYVIYVWEGVLEQHATGMAFAVARDKDHALEMLSEKGLGWRGLKELNEKEPKEIPIKAPFIKVPYLSAWFIYGSS